MLSHLESGVAPPSQLLTEAEILSGRMTESMKYLIFDKMLGPTVDRYVLSSILWNILLDRYEQVGNGSAEGRPTRPPLGGPHFQCCRSRGTHGIPTG